METNLDRIWLHNFALVHFTVCTLQFTNFKEIFFLALRLHWTHLDIENDSREIIVFLLLRLNTKTISSASTFLPVYTMQCVVYYRIYNAMRGILSYIQCNAWYISVYTVQCVIYCRIYSAMRDILPYIQCNAWYIAVYTV